jgi:hypothetical protein
MDKDKKFKADREKALDEIYRTLLRKMDELARQSAAFSKAENLSMPEIIEMEQKFRWLPAAIMVAADLKEEKPLKDVFARVSKRYQQKHPRGPVNAVATDFTRAAGLDGRASAFADVRKALHIAARDFDISYEPLSRDQVQWWLKKHPIGDQYIRIAHKENQRHYMKQALTALEDTLTLLEKGHLPPAPPAMTPPKPPKRDA